MAEYLKTYGDQSIEEDVLDLIENLSPKETQLLSGLGKSTAINTVHSWLTDTLDSAGSAAVAEGVDPTFPSITAPQRVTNITEIIAKPFSVSGTQRAVSHYGMADAYTYQAERAMKNWANAAESKQAQGKSSLINGRSLRWLSSARYKLLYRLQRLSERTLNILFSEATVQTSLVC